MNRPFLLAETAFHHQGEYHYATQLIDAAVFSGATAVKFQVVIDIRELIATTHPAFQELKDYVFSFEQWSSLFDYVIQKGLKLVIMPLDLGAFELIERYRSHIAFVELHSVSFYDESLKKNIKASGVDLMIGVGGRNFNEIESSFTFFGSQLRALMVGFQAFPSNVNDVRLRRISSLASAFPSVAIGYADHSSFDDPWAIDSNMVALALGASLFEKHITIDEGVKRVDFESAIGPEKFKVIRDKLNSTFQMLYGYSNPMEMSEPELRYRQRQKMVVASSDLRAGTLLKAEDLALKMTGRFDGFHASEDLIGRRLINDVMTDSIIRQDDVTTD